ncbi:hypothetical protein HK101_000954, partial [Irineochytrium annulatum]
AVHESSASNSGMVPKLLLPALAARGMSVDEGCRRRGFIGMATAGMEREDGRRRGGDDMRPRGPVRMDSSIAVEERRADEQRMAADFGNDIARRGLRISAAATTRKDDDAEQREGAATRGGRKGARNPQCLAHTTRAGALNKDEGALGTTSKQTTFLNDEG